MKSHSGPYQNTLLLLIVITAVAVDVSIPLLTVITDYFGLGNKQSQFIISSFLAGYGISMIPIGLVSDRYGRLPIMYIGIVVYIIAGFALVFAPDFETVLWGRFFQGVGGGVGPVNARAIARDMFSGKKLAKLMSSLTAALFLAPILAPFLGGQLGAIYSWRIAFLVPPILGVVLLLAVWLTAYETQPQKDVKPSIGKQFSKSISTFFASRDSIWALLIITSSFSGYQIILASTSLLMTDLYDIELKMVGTLFGMTALLIVAATFFNKKKAQDLSPEKLLGFGIALSLLASAGWLLCYFNPEFPFWVVWIFFTMYLTSFGFILPNTSTIALQPLQSIAGFASSIFGAGMIIGASIATAVAATCYNGTLTSITSGIAACALLSAILFYGKFIIAKDSSQ